MPHSEQSLKLLCSSNMQLTCRSSTAEMPNPVGGWWVVGGGGQWAADEGWDGGQWVVDDG